MNSGTWIALVLFGGFCMVIVYMVTKSWLQAILVRTHALLFLAAGLIGPFIGGWPGGLTRWAIRSINNLGGDMSSRAFDTPIVPGLITICLSAFLVLTFLPESWFKRSIPDPLSLSGLLLPGLLVSAPGPIGAAFRSLFEIVGFPMAELVASGIGR